MCNRLPDLLGIIFSIQLQLWSESLWELKVKQFKFRLEDAAAFLCDLWNRRSEVTPATPTHALELARLGGNRGRDKPALSCYGQAEANLLCCCSLWSTAVPIWSFSNTQFKTALCLSVWVTATWWLYCFCLHLMQMMFFQFLRWRSQCANKCGLDMRSMQETDVSWQKSTAVMLLKVLILFLFLVIFTWQLWSQFSAIYLGIQNKATCLFSELLCGRALFLTVCFFHTSTYPEPDSMPFRWGVPGIQSLANPQEVISSSPSHRSFCLSWSTGSLDWAGGCFSSLPS